MHDNPDMSLHPGVLPMLANTQRFTHQGESVGPWQNQDAHQGFEASASRSSMEIGAMYGSATIVSGADRATAVPSLRSEMFGCELVAAGPIVGEVSDAMMEAAPAPMMPTLITTVPDGIFAEPSSEGFESEEEPTPEEDGAIVEEGRDR